MAPNHLLDTNLPPNKSSQTTFIYDVKDLIQIKYADAVDD